MIAIFVILSAVTAAALVYSLRMNRLLSEQINALSNRLDTLSKKSGKRFNKYEKKLAQQRHKQMQQAAKQEKLRKEQEKLSREQTKQTATLSKLQFKLSLAESDIAAAQDRLTGLFAILDCIKAQQADTVPGSPADIRLAKQAVVLESQIATAERKLTRAQFDRQQAKEGLAA